MSTYHPRTVDYKYQLQGNSGREVSRSNTLFLLKDYFSRSISTSFGDGGLETIIIIGKAKKRAFTPYHKMSRKGDQSINQSR